MGMPVDGRGECFPVPPAPTPVATLLIIKHLLPICDTFIGVDTHLSVVIPDWSIIGTVTARHTRVLAGVWVWI